VARYFIINRFIGWQTTTDWLLLGWGYRCFDHMLLLVDFCVLIVAHFPRLWSIELHASILPSKSLLFLPLSFLYSFALLSLLYTNIVAIHQITLLDCCVRSDWCPIIGGTTDEGAVVHGPMNHSNRHHQQLNCWLLLG
jgi:hypothetical protein